MASARTYNSQSRQSMNHHKKNSIELQDDQVCLSEYRNFDPHTPSQANIDIENSNSVYSLPKLNNLNSSRFNPNMSMNASTFSMYSAQNTSNFWWNHLAARSKYLSLNSPSSSQNVLKNSTKITGLRLTKAFESAERNDIYHAEDWKAIHKVNNKKNNNNQQDLEVDDSNLCFISKETEKRNLKYPQLNLEMIDSIMRVSNKPDNKNKLNDLKKVHVTTINDHMTNFEMNKHQLKKCVTHKLISMKKNAPNSWKFKIDETDLRTLVCETAAKFKGLTDMINPSGKGLNMITITNEISKDYNEKIKKMEANAFSALVKVENQNKDTISKHMKKNLYLNEFEQRFNTMRAVSEMKADLKLKEEEICVVNIELKKLQDKLLSIKNDGTFRMLNGDSLTLPLVIERKCEEKFDKWDRTNESAQSMEIQTRKKVHEREKRSIYMKNRHYFGDLIKQRSAKIESLEKQQKEKKDIIVQSQLRLKTILLLMLDQPQLFLYYYYFSFLLQLNSKNIQRE